MSKCTGTSKQSGQPCKKDAVVGSTKCHIHGGKTPRGADSPNLKHGIYSNYLNPSLQAKLDATQVDNPLDLLPELNLQRAMISEHLSRFQTGFRLTAQDIDYMTRWSSEVGRTVERIVKMKNETALTQAEVRFLAMRVVELLGKYVAEPSQREAFIAELFAGVPALAPGAE